MLLFLTFSVLPNRFVADIKMMLICLGLTTAAGIYSCPYGTCHRVYKGKVTNKGRWRKRVDRCWQTCWEQYCKAMSDTGPDGGHDPKNYNGVRYLPIDLWVWEGEETTRPFLTRYTPPPLHLLLG